MALADDTEPRSQQAPMNIYGRSEQMNEKDWSQIREGDFRVDTPGLEFEPEVGLGLSVQWLSGRKMRGKLSSISDLVGF